MSSSAEDAVSAIADLVMAAAEQEGVRDLLEYLARADAVGYRPGHRRIVDQTGVESRYHLARILDRLEESGHVRQHPPDGLRPGRIEVLRVPDGVTTWRDPGPIPHLQVWSLCRELEYLGAPRGRAVLVRMLDLPEHVVRRELESRR